jgi:predicted PolB exonuclease-like 3'-5' exonuclease
MITFLDIETLPAPKDLEPQLQEVYERKKSTKSTNFGEFLRGTSLSGNWGRILCIGLAFDDQPAQIIQGEEKLILQTFWDQVRNSTLFVGHNALDFDLPFIWKRSVMHKVRPTIDLTFERYRTSPIFDTMRIWDQWGSPSTGLDQLARILGLESSKQGIDGSQIHDYFLANRLDEIYSYCLRDVELTRKVYHRLVFALPSQTKEGDI